MEQEWAEEQFLYLYYLYFFGFEQHTAQATNLIFFIPTSISAIITTWKDKLIDFKIGIPIIFFGIIGAIIGSKISINMNVDILKRCFGVFLGLIAAYEIYSLIKEYKTNKNVNNKIKD